MSRIIYHDDGSISIYSNPADWVESEPYRQKHSSIQGVGTVNPLVVTVPTDTNRCHTRVRRSYETQTNVPKEE